MAYYYGVPRIAERMGWSVSSVYRRIQKDGFLCYYTHRPGQRRRLFCTSDALILQWEVNMSAQSRKLYFAERDTRMERREIIRRARERQEKATRGQEEAAPLAGEPLLSESEKEQGSE